MRSFFQRRKLMIITIVALLIIGLVGGYLTLFFSTSTETKIVKVRLVEVLRDRGEEHWVEQYGLTSKQAADIVKHPENYRSIMYTCELNNTSGIIDIIDIKTNPNFSKDTKKRALYYSEEIENYQINPGQRYRESIRVLIKMDEEDTPEKLLEMAKKDRFTISGRKYLFLSDVPTNAPLSQFPMGSFSLEAKYEGE